MSDYDQERLSELAEELDRAKEKIRCLEADLKAARLPPAKPEPYRHQDGDFSRLCDNPHCRCKQ